METLNGIRPASVWVDLPVALIHARAALYLASSEGEPNPYGWGPLRVSIDENDSNATFVAHVGVKRFGYAAIEPGYDISDIVVACRMSADRDQHLLLTREARHDDFTVVQFVAKSLVIDWQPWRVVELLRQAADIH